ncbi:MAG TPA: glycosyltransferase family 4 protein [Pirellulaceae bacterium]|nr:glycosyltransferase family 4 protein [Pirellulaceae bacterium]
MIEAPPTPPDSAASPRRRLLFINRSYWPDVEATGQLLTELCERLAHRFDVTVMCGWPMHSMSADDMANARDRERAGVRIRRIWHTRFNKRSFWGRICNMLTFAVSASLAAMFGRRPDTVIVETDPPLLCLLGRVLQWARRTRLVCYLQDIYPDVAVALDKLRDGWLVRLLDRLFYGVYRRADAVVVLSRDMRQHLEAKGIDPAKLHCIPNWMDVSAVVPVKVDNPLRKLQGWQDRFVVMYSGNLGMSQPWGMLLEAMASLQSETQIQFALIGGGAAETFLREQIAQRRLANVAMLPYQPKSELSISLSAADVHLVFLDRRIAHCLMPSKIYGVLASGTAALVVAPPHSELAELVISGDAGTHVAEESAAALAAAIRQIAQQPDRVRHWGLQARILAEREFDIQRAVDQFLTVLA